MTDTDRIAGPEADPAPARRRRDRPAGRVWQRVPDLVVEGAFVLIAVVLALAADEWRENRSNAELASRAEQSIFEEVRSNRQELLRQRGEQVAMLARVDSLVQQLDADRESVDSLSLNFDLALLSNAAWEAARMTQAVHFMPFDRVRELSDVYEIQDLYDGSQRRLLDLVVGFGTDALDDAARATRSAGANLSLVYQLGGGLLEAYEETLVREGWLAKPGTDEDVPGRSARDGAELP